MSLYLYTYPYLYPYLYLHQYRHLYLHLCLHLHLHPQLHLHVHLQIVVISSNIGHENCHTIKKWPLSKAVNYTGEPHRSRVIVPPPPLNSAQLDSCASSGRAWWLRLARHSEREAGAPHPSSSYKCSRPHRPQRL